MASEPLTINDGTRDGLLMIADTRPDEDGNLHVTVRERIGAGCWVGGPPVARMRRLARRAVTEPTGRHLVRTYVGHDGCEYATFAVSGWDRGESQR